MAIITGVDGLLVEVLVNGQPVREYDDDEDEDTESTVMGSVTKYIEAQSDIEFAFRCTLSPGFPYRDDALDITYHIDGQWMSSSVIFQNQLGKNKTCQRDGQSFEKNGQWFIRKFTFAKLNIVEEPQNKSDDTMLKHLQRVGKLSVLVERIKLNNLPTQPCLERGVNLPAEVSEKALKGRGLTHAASLGRQQASTTRVNSVSAYSLDGPEKPFLSYNFKYCSHDKLKSLFIIPRSPSPVPLEDMDPDNMTAKQLRELARRQKAEIERSKALQLKVKRERGAGDDDDDNDDALSIAEVRPTKKRVMETIDLTDD